MNQKCWIKFEKVSKSFPVGFWGRKEQVLKEVSFALEQGSIVGFIGNNGAGKTTVLKLLMDFIRPDAGTISYPSSMDFTDFRKTLGYLPERPYYPDFLTGLEYLKYHWSLGGGEASRFKIRAQEVLKKVGLEAKGHVRLREYSKGMLQRMGVAQAILHRPSCLILDEPMSGLDPDGRAEIRALIFEEKSMGTSIFFSSHLLEDLQTLCDKILAIHNGEIVYFGDVHPVASTLLSGGVKALSTLSLGQRAGVDT